MKARLVSQFRRVDGAANEKIRHLARISLSRTRAEYR
jgi:hypothetical protein